MLMWALAARNGLLPWIALEPHAKVTRLIYPPKVDAAVMALTFNARVEPTCNTDHQT
jgi:hypothetical protein